MVRYEVDLSIPYMHSDVLIDSFCNGAFEVVSIKVGPEQTFRLPLQHITTIPFFKKAFEGGFKEAQEKSITLAEDDAEVFKLFLHWLYRGLSKKELNLVTRSAAFWTRFFLMADKWCLKRLTKNLAKHVSNKILDGFTRVSDSIDSGTVVDSVTLALNHPIRYLMIHHYCLRIPSLNTPETTNALEMLGLAGDVMRWQGLLANTSRINGLQYWKEPDVSEGRAPMYDQLILPLLFDDEPMPLFLLKWDPKGKGGNAEDARRYLKNTILNM